MRKIALPCRYFLRWRLRPGRHLLFLFLLMLAQFAVAQTTYTQSVSHSCQFATGYADVCNGLPLDQGGTWQFIVANQAFSINSNGLYIFGNPGNPGTGGLTVSKDTITYSTPGELDFTWVATDPGTGHKYGGNAVVRGRYTKGCNNHGCWHTLVVDSATITVQ